MYQELPLDIIDIIQLKTTNATLTEVKCYLYSRRYNVNKKEIPSENTSHSHFITFMFFIIYLNSFTLSLFYNVAPPTLLAFYQPHVLN